MPTPFSNLRSKLNRAICAYLISQGCGSVDDVLPFNSTKEKSYPRTVVNATISKPEQNFTGNRRISVHISIKGSAQPDDNDASRIAFDERVAKTMDALMQTGDEQTLRYTAGQITEAGNALAVDETYGQDLDAAASAKNNADMTDFTCIDWYEAGEGEGIADEQGCDWEQVLMFDAVACPSALG